MSFVGGWIPGHESSRQQPEQLGFASPTPPWLVPALVIAVVVLVVVLIVLVVVVKDVVSIAIVVIIVVFDPVADVVLGIVPTRSNKAVSSARGRRTD